MKIAIIGPWAVSDNAVGGTERFVQDLAETFQKLGNDVDVYMLSGYNHQTNNVNYINMDLFGTGKIVDEYILRDYCGDFFNESAFDNMCKLLESKFKMDEYDFIQLNSQLFLKAWRNNKRIFTIHTNPFEYKQAFGQETFDTMIRVMRNEANFPNTIFVVPSNHYAKQYSKLICKNVIPIHHAICSDRLKIEVNKNSILKKYDLGEQDKIRILLPSRIEPVQKRPLLFIRNLKNLDANLKSKLQIICTGLDKQYLKYADDIKQFCSKNKLEVKLMRFDKMDEAYKIADIVALPSRSESFGYSALESLSLGIPTIMSSLPTFKEIIKGYNGNVFVFKNEKELKLEIRDILYKEPKITIVSKEWLNRYDLISWGTKYLQLI